MSRRPAGALIDLDAASLLADDATPCVAVVVAAVERPSPVRRKPVAAVLPKPAKARKGRRDGGRA